jgi:DNA mismatch endonuclease, patch repair protein
MGYRYALHKKDLPGKPDLVFSRRRKIIFLNGCFFHMHNCRYGSVKPRTNTEFWQTKRLSNVTRDKKNLLALKNDGWQVLTIWECWTKPAKIGELPDLLRTFLS